MMLERLAAPLIKATSSPKWFPLYVQSGLEVCRVVEGRDAKWGNEGCNVAQTHQEEVQFVS
jgi:hypothetical protein